MRAAITRQELEVAIVVLEQHLTSSLQNWERIAALPQNPERESLLAVFGRRANRLNRQIAMLLAQVQEMPWPEPPAAHPDGDAKPPRAE